MILSLNMIKHEVRRTFCTNAQHNNIVFEDLNFVCEMLFQIQFVPISFQQAYKAGKKQPNEPHNVENLAIMSKNRAAVTWSGVCLF